MDKKNVLLMCGGGGEEHEVSLVSAQYFEDQLAKIPWVETHYLQITKDGKRVTKNGDECELRKNKQLIADGKTIDLHFAIPCFHGFPGETGDIQSVFELMGLPYFGCGSEASILSFNKISTKLWLDVLDIPNTPYIFLGSAKEIDKAKAALKKWNTIFVKASNQGSSRGTYKVENENELETAIEEAFRLSPYVLVEKGLKGRELEISVFEYQGKIQATAPGEILCPSGFYTYEEKYSPESKTTSTVKAESLTPETIEAIKAMGIKAFSGLKMRHMARIDFFYSDDGIVYLNEPNTFPGHTPISMFPTMLEASGIKYNEYLEDIIKKEVH